jgi:hypothetical protein
VLAAQARWVRPNQPIKGDNVFETIVNASANTVQILALVAAIVFGVAAILSLRPSTFVRGLFAIGLAFVALSIMFFA